MCECIGFFVHLYKLLGKKSCIYKASSKRYHHYMGKFLRYLEAIHSVVLLNLLSSISNLLFFIHILSTLFHFCYHVQKIVLPKDHNN